MDRRPRIPVPILIFFAIDLALGIAYAADRWAGGPSPRLTLFLDLDQEGNVPSWYSSAQWLCVAALVGTFAHANFRLSARRSWLLLALPLLFVAFSLDEAAQIHEWVGGKSDRLVLGRLRGETAFPRTGIWMFVIGLPFLAAFGGLMASVSPYFRRCPGARVKMLVGMGVVLAGTIGFETLTNFVAEGTRADALQVLAEEMCEMLGSTIVLWGSYELLAAHGFALRMDRAEAGPP